MQNKILILLLYYNRPKLVQNALTSILKAHKNYPYWHLAFIDDGSPNPGKPIVEELLSNHLNQITFYNSNMTAEQKEKEGCRVGDYMNQATLENESDIVITLCDDDELHPEYFVNLNNFFNNNPDEISCYSKVHIYNPFMERSEDVECLAGHYNMWSGPIRPSCRVDVSQVAWRRKACTEFNVKWLAPCTGNHDVYFLEELYQRTNKLTAESGFVSQYKGIHSGQLGTRAFDMDYEFNLNPHNAWNAPTESNDSDIEIDKMFQKAIGKAHMWIDNGNVEDAGILLDQLIRVSEAKVQKQYPMIYFMLGVLWRDKELLEKAQKYTISKDNKVYVQKYIDNFHQLAYF